MLRVSVTSGCTRTLDGTNAASRPFGSFITRSPSLTKPTVAVMRSPHRNLFHRSLSLSAVRTCRSNKTVPARSSAVVQRTQIESREVV